jgi:LPXTG-site transpeptidase (sortase) family protein
LLIAASVLLICLGGGIGLHVAFFYWRSSHTGEQLLNELAQSRAHATDNTVAQCESTTPRSGALGILTAPTIGLRAPVVQGTGNSQLDVAVGHNPASAMPGEPGTSVLAAHDVTWFTDIDALAVGQSLVYEDNCATYHFEVTSRAVVTSGAPVYSTPNATQLVLVTCWPTDALFLTDKRYVVFARLAGSDALHGTPSPPTPPTVALTIPASAALIAQASQQSAPLGVLGFSGSPDPAWRQSPAPMEVERSALTEYFAAVLTAEQGDSATWTSLAGGAGMPGAMTAPLHLAEITHYDRALSMTLKMNGPILTAVDLSTDSR